MLQTVSRSDDFLFFWSYHKVLLKFSNDIKFRVHKYFQVTDEHLQCTFTMEAREKLTRN